MRYLVLLLLPLFACRAPQGALLESPLMARVQAVLDSTCSEVPRVVYKDAPTTPGGAFAVCYTDRIVIMGKGREMFDYVIAHELVHWYIDESPYEGLPHFIEEGLADWIACGLMGLLEARIAENARIGMMTADPRHISLDVKGYMQLPHDVSVGLGRAGFDLVNRLGLTKLRELVSAGTSPMGYLRAAGVLE